MATILRLAQASNDQLFVLVHISAAGSCPLDLKLIGTESELVFDTQLTQKRTSSLMAKSCPCEPSEWDQILAHIFLGGNTREEQHGLLEGVEAVAKVEKKFLVIIIQKKTEGIIQRLGSIELPRRKDSARTDDVDLYNWCGIALNQSKASIIQKDNLVAEANECRIRLEKLNDSFDELTQAKKDHEDRLLEAFALLLNEKKLKIRDQQRLLASAKVDSGNLAAVEASRSTKKPRIAGRSRAGKRKAGKDSNEHGQGDSDGFEKMDLDGASVANNSDQEERHTPSGESTAEETEDESSVILSNQLTKGAALRVPGTAATQSRANSPPEHEKGESLPPTRVLPFTKKATPSARITPATEDDGSETESDNEL